MNTDRVRNLLIVSALGLMTTGMTYFFFRQAPQEFLSGTYVRVNLAVLFVFPGALLVAVAHARDFWFELVGAALLIFATTSIAVFVVSEGGVRVFAVFCAFMLAGAASTWALVRHVSVTSGYRFTAVLLTFAFAFVVLYILSSIATVGSVRLVAPLLIYTGIFAAATNGLKKEIGAVRP